MARTRTTARIVQTDANASVEDPQVECDMQSQEEGDVTDVWLQLNGMFNFQVSI